MAPQRSNKRTISSSSNSVSLEAFPGAPVKIPTKEASPTRTPPQGQNRNPVTISQLQKEALIEDLQQELAERARRLRAQYALQAANLRTRLEYRIERIPMALRKAKLGDLLEKHASKFDASPSISKYTANKESSFTTSKSTSKPATQPAIKASMSESTRARPFKRNSDNMEDADKENASLDSPRKRNRLDQAVSRHVPQSQILSPKSNNSRQLPHSPIKGFGSPVKAGNSRPVSPSKTISTIAAAPTAASLARTTGNKAKPKATTVRANNKPAVATSTAASGTLRVKRAPPVAAKNNDLMETRASDASDGTIGSTGTTIVKSRTMGTEKKSATSIRGTKTGTTSKITSVKTKKTVEPKVATTAPATSKTGRSLRMRA